MIILNPIFTILYFVNMGIDITIFFLIIRLVLNWRHIQWLVPFSKIGGLLVERITKTAGKFWSSRSNRRLSDNGKIMISLGVLALAKLLLAGLLKCLV